MKKKMKRKKDPVCSTDQVKYLLSLYTMFLCACCIHYTVETRQFKLIPEILKQKLKIRQNLDKLIRENEGCYSFLAEGKKYSLKTSKILS